jgi:glycerol dehydrogenase
MTVDGGSLATVFAAPGKYIQGRDAVGRLGEVLEQLGSKKPLVLGDPIVPEVMGDALEGLPGATRVEFGGECSPEEIDRVAREAKDNEADAIVGIGGGKTMDTAKAVAHPAGLSLVIVPTIASTDAPTSALSVVYDEDGAFKEYRFFERNPDAIARLCYDTLLEHGLAARLACEQDAVTPAFEKVVEANTLLSGLGFESGGLAAAHSVHNGLTVLEGTHHYWHGEKVAFGVISMLMLEDRPADVVEEVVDFCLEVGLPVALEDIGLDGVGREELERVAEAACAEGETIHNMPVPVNPEMVLDAMLAADAFGRQRRALMAGEAELPAVAH